MRKGRKVGEERESGREIVDVEERNMDMDMEVEVERRGRRRRRRRGLQKEVGGENGQRYPTKNLSQR